MKTLRSLGIGFGIGALIGTVLIALFSPTSGKAFREQVKQGFEDTMDEARLASANRQLELQAELEQKLGKALPRLTDRA